ncbi:phosphate acetyltransferase [Candidatus Saganbacteria bacterium]|nr:phosphate acetyltransferase [Candidatus Saganbacteria bacterium]
MDFISDIWNKAKKLNKRIVLPETNDIRVLKATEFIIKSKLAQVILIGNENDIARLAQMHSINLTGSAIIDPKKSPQLPEFAQSFKVKREKKGMVYEKALEILTTNYLFFGAMLVDSGNADGMVSGAVHTTAGTMRALLQCVGVADGASIVSSFFAMISPKKEFGEEGLIFFADCAVNPNPTSEQLAQIAIQTSDSFSRLTSKSPRVAMLSFSTKGSASHPDVAKVTNAVEIAKKMRPNLVVDGEMQLDAAIIPIIGNRKAPGSEVAGYANILIFPTLDAGNIGYKLTERLGGALALGPILQGAKKPINDLSRGCSVDDIVNVSAITAIQAS